MENQETQFEHEKYFSICKDVTKRVSDFFVELTYYVISQDDQLMEDSLVYYLSKTKDENGNTCFPILTRDALKCGDKNIKGNLNYWQNEGVSKKLHKIFSRTKSAEKRRILCHDMLINYSDTAAGIKMIQCTKYPSVPDSLIDAIKSVIKKGDIPYEGLHSCLKLRNETEGHVNKAKVSEYTKVKCKKNLSFCQDTINCVRDDLKGDTKILEQKRKVVLDEIAKDRRIIEYKKIPLDSIRQEMKSKKLTNDDLESIIVERTNLRDDYCVEEQTLYWNNYKNVFVEIARFCDLKADTFVKLFGPDALNSNIEQPVRNNQEKNKSKDELSKVYHWERFLPEMAKYRSSFLKGTQLDELAKYTTVLADCSFWMDDKCRRYLADDFMPRMKRYNRAMAADWNTRLDLFEREKNEHRAYSEREKEAAYNAHNMMRVMRASRGLRYMKTSSVYASSDYGIIKLAEAHPDALFTVFSKNTKFAELLISKNVKNIIPINYIIPLKRCTIWFSFIDGVQTIFSGEPRVDKGKDNLLGQTKTNETRNDSINQLKTGESRKPPFSKTLENKQAVLKKREITQKSGTKSPSLKNDRVENTRKTVSTSSKNFVQIKESRTLYTSDGKKYYLQKEIGKGGEGSVFVTNNPDFVAKIYHSNQLSEARQRKLEKMVQIKLNLPTVCWPLSLLYYDNKQFAGYLMKNAVGYEEFGKSVLSLNKSRVSTKLMKGWDRLALVELCIAICRTFEKLNKHDILMGDVNPRNILLNCHTESHSDFVFVDCDSYQIGNYPCPVGTEVFTSPKIYTRYHIQSGKLDYSKILRNQEDEDYSIASLLFHILMLNQSPFAGKGVTDITTAMRENNFAYRLSGDENNTGVDTPDGPYRLIWNNMPKYVKDLFGKVFNEQQDVTMDSWIRSLISYREAIKRDDYTAELKPVLYWDTKDNKFTEYFDCDLCGEHRNMPKERYQSQEDYGQPHLCNNCITIQMQMKKKEESQTRRCKRCRRQFKTTEWDGWKIDHGFKNQLCPRCREIRNRHFNNQ